LRRAVNDLTRLLAVTRRIAVQTRQRLAGTTPDGATRRVSLHDRDARPIAKGRLGRPVEFGYKAQVLDNDDGVVLDHTLEQGNPADAPQLAPAVKRAIARTGRKPRTVTADRGYGEKNVDDALHDHDGHDDDRRAHAGDRHLPAHAHATAQIPLDALPDSEAEELVTHWLDPTSDERSHEHFAARVLAELGKALSELLAGCALVG